MTTRAVQDSRLRRGWRRTAVSPVRATSRKWDIGVPVRRGQGRIGEEGTRVPRAKAGPSRDRAALRRAGAVQARVEPEGAGREVEGRPEPEAAHEALEGRTAGRLLGARPALRRQHRPGGAGQEEQDE